MRTDIDELRGVPLFADFAEDELVWLASVLVVRDVPAGEVLFREGEQPHSFVVLFRGELMISREIANGSEVMTRLHVGDGREVEEGGKPTAANFFTGDVQMLNRLPYFATATSTEPSRVGLLGPDDFDAMLACCPQVARVMLPAIAWRIRATESRTQQDNSLRALGTIAAGLAHELNNPAAVALRGVTDLGPAVRTLVAAAAQWPPPPDLPARLSGLRPPEGALERADREDAIEGWLDDQGVRSGGEDAGLLADAGVDVAWLERLENPAMAVRYLCAHIALEALCDDLRASVDRICALVEDVRSYTQLDRAPVQEVDIEADLDRTLRMLSARLTGIRVHREYVADLPSFAGRGAELNQVWTHLIANAADALAGGGDLWVRTGHANGHVTVEIADSGPGIPDNVRERLFEPFFTTKDIGKGTGLGLHVAWRIVTERHHGTVEVTSTPGDTRFTVWLPLSQHRI